MTIIIEIKPEVEAELSRQAAAHGVDIVSYAASLLEEAAQIHRRRKRLIMASLMKRFMSLRSSRRGFPAPG